MLIRYEWPWHCAAGVSAERLRSSGITDGLSFAFRQLSEGGGPKKIAERVEIELKVCAAPRASNPQRVEHGIAS